MYLIRNQTKSTHVSYDTISEFEKIILNDSSFITKIKLISPFHKFYNFFFKVFNRFGVNFILKTNSIFLINPINDKKHNFIIMMGLDEKKYLPFAFFNVHCKSVYIFDAWSKDHRKIADFINKYKIDYMFVTASMAAEKLKCILPQMRIYWIPEGVSPTEYRVKDYHDKKTDILAFGRKYDIYHNLISDSLRNNGVSYLFEKTKGEIIFPSRTEFVNGLADAKISICFPSSLTHPERAGDIETITIRYFQSMISKCLIVGQAPQELVNLFGYDPVIEVDWMSPVDQLITILDNYNDYIPIIEKNYKQVIENHTWDCRWKQIKEIYKSVS